MCILYVIHLVSGGKQKLDFFFHQFTRYDLFLSVIKVISKWIWFLLFCENSLSINIQYIMLFCKSYRGLIYFTPSANAIFTATPFHSVHMNNRSPKQKSFHALFLKTWSIKFSLVSYFDPKYIHVRWYNM
jgi:hypothetical protein